VSTYFIIYELEGESSPYLFMSMLYNDCLEKAMVEPEKYKDLFVRVGGFSARFVDLPKDVQREVFSRNTY